MLASAWELTYPAQRMVVLIAECPISFCTVLTSTPCINQWLHRNLLKL